MIKNNQLTVVAEKILETLYLMKDCLRYQSIALVYKNLENYQILNSIPQNDIRTHDINEQITHFLSIFKPDSRLELCTSRLSKWFEDNSLSIEEQKYKNISSFCIKPISVKKDQFYICLTSNDEITLTSKENKLLESFIYNIQNHISDALLEFKNNNKLDIVDEELFEIIFNSVPEAISFHELPSHRTIAVNNAFLEYTGYTEEQVKNKTGKDLQLWYNEEDRLRYRDIISEEGKVDNFATKFIFKNGRISDGLVSGKIVLFRSKPHLLLIIKDISHLVKMQMELEQNEKKFRSVFNLLPDAVSINRLDKSMAFTDFNEAFVKTLGLDPHKLIGKSGFELDMWAKPEQRDKYLETIKTKGKVVNMEAQYKHPDGSILEGLISANKIEIGNHPHLLVVLKNIDQIISMKRDLRSSEAKFRSIFNYSPDAININKLSTYEFVDINRSFEQITGFSRKELIGKSFIDFNFLLDRDMDSYLDLIKEKGQVSNLETKIRLKSGRIIHMLISATIVKLNGELHLLQINRNIENIKGFQKDKKESESKFKTIVEKSHASILIIDDQGKFIYFNPQSQILFGYTIDELLGESFVKVLHPNSIDLVKERYRKRQNGEFVPEHYEFQIVRKNGEIRDVEISSSTYKGADGNTRTISQLLDVTERKKAISKAYLEQQKSQRYLDIAAFILIAIHKNGTIEMVNKKACEILGYREDELVGSDWFETCLPEHNKEKTKARFLKIIDSSDQVHVSENNILTKDQKERIIVWHSTVIKDEKGIGIGLLSSGEDVTEKISTLKILNQTKVVAILWKYVEKSNIFPIQYVSNNVDKLIGYSSEELMSNKIRYIDLIHPDDKNRVLNEVESYTKDNHSANYQHEYYRLRTKDGNWIWVEDQTEFVKDEKGKITHLNGLLIDVTEKKKSLELIQENEERYRTIFYSNLDGLVIFDSMGKIVEVNDVICKMYGYTKDELINRKDYKKMQIAKNIQLSHVKKHLLTHEYLNSESIDNKSDGTQFHINARLRWINYKNENHILAIIRDISDKKSNELALIKAKEKAEESDQLKSSFLANMSHEIRTPMNSIIGFSNLLDESDLSEEEKQSFISRIKNNSEQLLRLINDIIDISKIEANQVNLIYESINIQSFFEKLYESFEYDAKQRKVFLKYQSPEKNRIKSFMCDFNRLTQIMSNLISNALKFTPEGGTVRIGFYYDLDPNSIILFVKDNGIGIPKDAQKHIFDRFRQAHIMTHTDYGGTGLGLSISKGLVENMNGRIWFESEEGVGTQFSISLPIKNI